MTAQPIAADLDRFLPLIAKIARKIHANIAGSVELDELISMGVEGFLEARLRMDPRRREAFAGYAQLRVRGHILDNLGNTAGLPRRAWRALCRGRLHAAPRAVDLRDVDLLITIAGEQGPPMIIESIDAARARRAVNLLPPDLARLVRGLYFEGRSLNDVARELDISPSWASRLHRRAIDFLRDRLLLTAA
jgi:RNA polymerase sigma factor (sigma-70 family)